MIKDYLKALLEVLKTDLKIKNGLLHQGDFSEADLQRIINKTPQIVVAPLKIKSAKTQDTVTLKTVLEVGVFLMLSNYELEKMLDILNVASVSILNFAFDNASLIGEVQTQNLYSASLDKKAVSLWALDFSVEIYTQHKELDKIDYEF